jgi:hypothetical protein
MTRAVDVRKLAGRAERIIVNGISSGSYYLLYNSDQFLTGDPKRLKSGGHFPIFGVDTSGLHRGYSR